MFCDRILGNLDDEPRGSRVDWIDLTWRDCAARALRKQSRAGENLRIVLALGQRIGHRDILVRQPDTFIAANLLECDVLVTTPQVPESLASAALELGNLHVPVEITGDSLIVLPDGPAIGVFSKYSIDYFAARRRFVPMKCSVLAEVSTAKDFTIARK